MRDWDFSLNPYRGVQRKVVANYPEQGPVHEDLPSDVFMDALGRMWYAGTERLRYLLPKDPMKCKTVPSEFWHPSRATRPVSDDYHRP